jgi:3-dehydroquinate synthase
MRRVTVGLSGRSYDILIGEALLDRLDEFVDPLDPTSIAIVTNATVDALYGERVRRALASRPVGTIRLADGEAHKSWPAVEQILDALVASGADRRSVIVALGGGVVGDVAGFAAAIYMRGIRFVQVPTTLLAQVDSSVGGKTGINHPRGKNLVGAFHQPELVVTDTSTLATLPAREVSAGLAEVLKHGLLADAGYFFDVSAQLAALRKGDASSLASVIGRSCEIKAAVVARDEREAGERALLNLGHTFGHAIEALTGYSRWLHGEAVGCGLALAADLSRRLGMIDAASVEAIGTSLLAAGLPMRIEGLSTEAAIAAMRGDKKAEGGQIRFVLLERIGRAVQRTVPEAELRATLAAGGYR